MRNFTKLRLWQLTDLNKCVYLDADALALSCLDDMFLAPAFSAVLDNMAADAEFSETKFQTPGWAVRTAHAEPKRSYFNAGVFVFEPSEAEFNSMMEDLATFPLTRFAEQDFLNARHAGRWNQLPLSFNWGKPSFWLCPQLCCFDALKVVHFSGRLKPWMRARDGTWRATDVAAASPIERAAVCGKDATPPDENLARAVDRWWAAFDSGHGALASVRGATAQPAEPSSVVLRELPAPAPSPSVSKAAPPKLLFVVHRAYPHDGGSEYYVHWLASEAASRGVQVTVLAGTHKGSQVRAQPREQRGQRSRARALACSPRPALAPARACTLACPSARAGRRPRHLRPGHPHERALRRDRRARQRLHHPGPGAHRAGRRPRRLSGRVPHHQAV